MLDHVHRVHRAHVDHSAAYRWAAAFCRASSYPPARPVATTDAHTLTAVSGPMGAPKSNHQTGYFEHPRLPRSWPCLLSRAPRASRALPHARNVRPDTCSSNVLGACAWETHQSRTGSFQPCNRPARNQKTKQSTPYCYPGLQLRRYCVRAAR